MDQRLVLLREVEPFPIDYEVTLCPQLLRNRDRSHVGSQSAERNELAIGPLHAPAGQNHDGAAGQQLLDAAPIEAAEDPSPEVPITAEPGLLRPDTGSIDAGRREGAGQE